MLYYLHAKVWPSSCLNFVGHPACLPWKKGPPCLPKSSWEFILHQGCSNHTMMEKARVPESHVAKDHPSPARQKLLNVESSSTMFSGTLSVPDIIPGHHAIPRQGISLGLVQGLFEFGAEHRTVPTEEEGCSGRWPCTDDQTGMFTNAPNQKK